VKTGETVKVGQLVATFTEGAAAAAPAAPKAAAKAAAPAAAGAAAPTQVVVPSMGASCTRSERAHTHTRARA
jgi:2-oxoglutarate dehydrogenase E2 component (dihydrolipoamide succinyltransferase)